MSGARPRSPRRRAASRAIGGEPVHRVRWTPSYRITGLRARPEAIFEQITDPSDLDDILAIIAAGTPVLIDPSSVAVGPGAGWIMLPFVRFSPVGTRFSDGTYGVYYASKTLETAIAETCYHYARFLAATVEPATLLGVRVLRALLRAELVDIRGRAGRRPELYDPDPVRYGSAQAWARTLRTAGAAGVVYDSVRDSGGQCAAVFRPNVLSRCQAGLELAYEWDGEKIAAVYELRQRVT